MVLRAFTKRFGDNEHRWRSDGDPAERGEDVAAVRLKRLLLVLRHQVDVELIDPDRLELAQLCDRQLRIAEDSEAVADLVRHELAVLCADAGVLVVVIELPRLDVVGEHRRDD